MPRRSLLSNEPRTRLFAIPVDHAEMALGADDLALVLAHRPHFLRFACRLRLDVARNLTAAFDLDLTIANCTRDPTSRLDQQSLAHGEIAFEATPYFGLFDRGGALEQTALGNGESTAIDQIGLDAALDRQFLARSDIAR